MNFLFLNTSCHTLQRVAVVRSVVKGQKEEEGQECPGQSEAGMCYRDGGTTAWQQERQKQNIWEGGEETEKSDQLSLQFDWCIRHPLPMSLEDIFSVHRKFLKQEVFRSIGTKSKF